MGIRNMLKKLDLAEWAKEKYGLTGWQAEVIDALYGLFLAAIIYYGILPLLLGANPPAVIVQSCSMAGTFQVGDIIVLKGASFNDINAPLVKVNSTVVNFSILPNSRSEQTKQIVFQNGDPRVLNVTRKGDVIVYISPLNGKQIIHRVIARVITSDGKHYFITKGDANNIPDQAKIECEEWINEGSYLRCIKLSNRITKTCQYPSDVGWPGCISSPVPENDVVGKAIFDIPLIGQIKLIIWDIITLGHGYPDKVLC